MKIGFIGSGPVATRLGERFTRAGHDVTLGHREGPNDFARAVEGSDVAVIAIPYRVCASVLPGLAEKLAGRVVIDATNALAEDYSPLPLPEGRSAAELIATIVPRSRVVKAFNTIFADAMAIIDHTAPLAAFIAGQDRAANQLVAGLAEDARYTPFVIDALVAARHLEAMAHLNIALAFSSGVGTLGGFTYTPG